MKTVASFIKALLVLLIPVVVCQCSGKYNLVDYKEYVNGRLDEHISYNYNGAGELKSKTRFSFGHQNTLTLYDVKIYETGIDTIETTYEIFVRDSTDYDHLAYKYVNSYSLDGIKRSSTYYWIKDGQWIEDTHMFYDDKGRKIESNWEDKEIHYIYYDSLGRCIGARTIINGDTPEDGYCRKDTVIFSKEGSLATRTESTHYHMDSIQGSKFVYLYEIDKQGRIISYSYPPSLQKTTYLYDRKGRLKRETEYIQYDSVSPPTKRTETVNRYLLGYKIWSVKYHYERDWGKSVALFTVYKYDFRHKLLLEEKMYDDIFDKKLLGRKIWTYEKAK